MATVPEEIPVTMPLPPLPLTIAIAVSALVHAPPLVPSVTVIADPAHTPVLPAVTAPGDGATVMTEVAVQPDASMYDTVAVPADAPYTDAVVSPVAATVAAPPLTVQLPPVVVSDNCMLCPAQTTPGPSMGENGFTISGFTDWQPVPSV
jgi:hypothetical protein